jgi:1-acyl-sn-glycerol-3-phosphate acyltransferase
LQPIGQNKKQTINILENIWYKVVRFYVKIGLFFTLKKISVHGKENIPKTGAILFVANHQNALIDAILIPTTNNRNIHFLTRASAFKNKLADKILRSLNMIPVYRLRDGKNSIEKNIAIFEQCFEFLKNEKALQVFVEGEHHQLRRVIHLKKGFARIILGTLQKYPDLNIEIVPVGINYNYHLKYPCSTSIYYGKPINANQFFDVKNPDFRFQAIIKEVRDALKKLTLHIEDTKNYDEILSKLNAANVNYLKPIKANKLLEKVNELVPQNEKRAINWLLPLYLLAKINSVFPLLIWYYLKPKIKDIIFTNTFRFALITTVFPLFYLIQSFIIYIFFNLNYALIYLLTCIILGIITTKTMKIN